VGGHKLKLSTHWGQDMLSYIHATFPQMVTITHNRGSLLYVMTLVLSILVDFVDCWLGS